MKTNSVLWRGQSRSVVEAVEAWKQSHDEAMQVRDLEQVVRFSIFMGQAFLGVARASWESLFEGKLHPVVECGEHLLKGHEYMLEALRVAREVVEDAEKDGYDVEGSGEVAETITALEASLAKLRNKWPRFNQESLARGLDQAERGEFVPFEELRRGVQG